MAKKSNRTKGILAVAILLIVALYFILHTTSSDPQQQYEIEKKGAGSVIDFTTTCQQVHKDIDTALGKNGITIGDIKETTKEISRQKIEGIIRWHTRQILLKPSPAFNADKLQSILKAASSKSKVLAMEADTYQGVAVTRFDIGLQDKLDGETVTIICDRVYVLKEGAGVLPGGEKQQPVKVKAKLAIIIDDFGYSHDPVEAFANITQPITFAVLPYRPYSNEAAARGLSSGHQVILHLPMEPLGEGGSSEPTAIMVGMGEEQIREIAQKAIQSLPGIIGVNNHQGSKATADKQVMKNVLQVIKNKNLFFVDSRTNHLSVASDTARQMGIHTGENQLFIDNVDDVVAVKKQIRIAQDMALQHGSAIIIGHARMNTATAVRDMVPELIQNGVQLVFVSQLIR